MGDNRDSRENPARGPALFVIVRKKGRGAIGEPVQVHPQQWGRARCCAQEEQETIAETKQRVMKKSLKPIRSHIRPPGNL